MRKCATLFEFGVQKWNVVGFLVCGFFPSFFLFPSAFWWDRPFSDRGIKVRDLLHLFLPPSIQRLGRSKSSPPLMKRCHEKEKKKFRLFLPRACCVFDSLRGQFCESFLLLSLPPPSHTWLHRLIWQLHQGSFCFFCTKNEAKRPSTLGRCKSCFPLFWGLPSLRCHLLTSPKSINSPRGKGQRGKGEGGGGGEAINAVASKLLLLLWCQTDTSLYYSEEDEGKLCNNRIRKKGHSIQSSPYGLF